LLNPSISLARLSSLRAMADAPVDTRRRRRVLGMDVQQRQAERRRLLLAAALELFGTRGYAKSSIELLCQTAGIGTNSFYELFSSKEEVLIALYDEISADLRAAVTDAYAARSDDLDAIRPLVAAFVHCAVDDPRVAQVAFVEAAGVSPEMEAHRRETRNQFVAGLEAIGRDLREASPRATGAEVGSRPGPSPRRNAVAVVGAIVEMTVDWLHDPAPDPLERLIDDITHHCLRVVEAIIDETGGG
jgi:AcrR family transcriptional regulator